MKGVTLWGEEKREQKSFYKNVLLAPLFCEGQTYSTESLAGNILFEHKELWGSTLNNVNDY